MFSKFPALEKEKGKTLNCAIEVVGLGGSKCLFFPCEISLFFKKKLGNFRIFLCFSSVNLNFFSIFDLNFDIKK